MPAACAAAAPSRLAANARGNARQPARWRHCLSCLSAAGAFCWRKMSAPARRPASPWRWLWKRRRLRFQTQVWLLAFGGAAPAVFAAVAALYLTGRPDREVLTVGVVTGAFWLVCAATLVNRVTRPLQLVSAMLGALREGDTSLKAHRADPNDPLGQVLLEINALSGDLGRSRVGLVESLALFNRVVDEIEVAVFTFDPSGRLGLANAAGAALFREPATALRGRTVDQLGLDGFLRVEAQQALTHVFPARTGRWVVRRAHFRDQGQVHLLMLVTDLSAALRAEETHAWRSIIRVLGHEINNSLAPMISIADTLERIAARDPLPEDWREDLRDGLQVIRARSTALSRFTEGYARLARLPPPQPQPVSVAEMVARVAEMEQRLPPVVEGGPDIAWLADAPQIEQVLINLLKNAADAALPVGGGVRLRWRAEGAGVALEIDDDGLGIANPKNTFVPFFTTKPGGSGIGLTLSRQIAEAHHGALTLQNRPDGRGARAILTLPRA